MLYFRGAVDRLVTRGAVCDEQKEEQFAYEEESNTLVMELEKCSKKVSRAIGAYAVCI